jgi:SAM-dependent methyltransferase
VKTQLRNILFRSSFPQTEFAHAIARSLPPTAGHRTMIDAPCGFGVTSFHLSRIPNTVVAGYDLDPASVDLARRCFGSEDRLSFSQSDIHNVLEERTQVDVFCLINSLFLLPDPQNLLRRIHDVILPRGDLFLIVPNIRSDNYRRFLELSSDSPNSLELSREQFKPYLAELNLEVKSIEGLIHTSIYGRSRNRLATILRPVMLRASNTFARRFSGNPPAYYLIHARPASCAP